VTSVTKAALKAACDYLMANAEIREIKSLDGSVAALPYHAGDAAAMEAAVLFTTLATLHGK
jgi:hypothetical protein